MSFQGYSEDARAFFMALRFNNNREFFQDNREWYLRDVRTPSLALAEALAKGIEAIDPEIDARPHRALSRINRDTRFSRDKSPYRDHVWISFRRPSEDKGKTPGFYAEIEAEGVFFGMGFYAANRPLMNALRRQMRAAPEEIRAIWEALAGEFALHGETYKRLAVPEEVPEILRPWYACKSFYLEKALPFSHAKSAHLAEEIGAGFERLAPLYQYVISCKPGEEDTQ